MARQSAVERLEKSMRDRYFAWERGRTTSPSADDFVLDLQDILKVTFTTELREDIADEIAVALDKGRELRTIAVIAVAYAGEAMQ